MHEALRAGLFAFAALSALGASPALFRRLHPIALLFLHLMGFSIAIGGVVADVLGRGDGRPLLLCYAAVVLVFAGQDGRKGVSSVAPRAIAAAAAGLGVLGLGGEAIVAAGLL